MSLPRLDRAGLDLALSRRTVAADLCRISTSVRPDTDERPLAGETPRERALRLAVAKAALSRRGA